jgi:16S rRNA (cytosine967-C5)-methyltransferase
MAPTRSQLEASTKALELVLAFDRPADAVLHDFFRAHRALGSRDRAFVGDTVYGVLRRKRTLEHLVSGRGPRSMVLAWLARYGSASVRDLAPALGADEVKWLTGLKAVPLDGLPPAVRLELPDWVVQRLTTQLPDSDLAATARGLNDAAPLDLRVNTLLAEREEVLRELVVDGIPAVPTPYSPVGVRVRGRPAINRHPLFTRGAIEVQDESSQLLGYLVAPRRHELIVDFCAGAGGKTLHLGALMHSHGRIYALDVSASRLARLRPRLSRSRLSNVHPQVIRNENDPRVKRLAGKIDRVLVDAPCSGLGTLRRNPDLKWRQTPQSVAELVSKQSSILRSVARLVKPGGRLIYATCSILREENEDIVSGFLADHGDFGELHCGDLLGRQGIPLDTGCYLRLRPHIHETDGFFAAVLERGCGNVHPPGREEAP